MRLQQIKARPRAWAFGRRVSAFSRLLSFSGILGVLFFLFVSTHSSSAEAYAWMIKHSYTGCATCHTDPSGGELLTPYGRVTSDLLLRMHYGERKAPEDQTEEDAPSPGVLWGAWETPEALALGGSFRNLYIVRPTEPGNEFRMVPVMQADLYGQLRVGALRFGGSLGIARVAVGSQHARPAQVTHGQGEEMNLISRTHFVGYDINEEFLVRAGRLNLPYGVRSPEHNSWARMATRTDRESSQQHGVALAYTGQKLRGEVMAILGNYQLGPDEFRERGYSLFLEAVTSSRLALGVSSKVTYAALDRWTLQENMVRQAHGLTARWAPWDSVAVLGEFNALFRSQADAGYVGFLQADYEPLQGLHFLLTGEVLDEGFGASLPGQVTSAGLGQPRFGTWLSVDWFFYKQFEFRTDAIFRQQEPVTILGQLHFYL